MSLLAACVVTPHVVLPCTYTLLFAFGSLHSEDTVHRSVFYRDDHQMKGKVASNWASAKIKGRRLVFSCWCWSRKKKTILRSRVDLTSTPAFRLGAVLADNSKELRKVKILPLPQELLFQTGAVFHSDLGLVLYTTQEEEQNCNYFEGPSLSGKGRTWPSQSSAQRAVSPVTRCVGQRAGLSCSHPHQSSTDSGCGEISDKEDFYRGYF